MRHVQEKHKMRMKAEQKCLQEERCKVMEEQKQFLNEEQEKSDEDMEVPQAIEKVLVFKSERTLMLSVDQDAVTQPVVIGQEKGLTGDSSIVQLNFAEDEMYEEEETPVNVIKYKAKGDINPVIISKETLDLYRG
ncbi:hypothetical protein TNIN_250091 [Trichonephila inaurata madagascariensis]|uniref:Uncharacterized protein n=1 Tax=Trichonephila inaurata madagascariensis TaxID=2747483 RepID=A0A8X7C2H1_9ARAC|nr:hypothetical protein TNIN_250091 [Trichonephila inaurata madagascariensis]